MRIFLDIDSRRLYSGPGKPLTKLEFKRRDNDAIELIFLRENVVQELPAGTMAKVGVKVDTEYASEFLAVTTVTQSGTGTDTVYTGELNFNTAEMAAAFAAEPVTLAAMLEVEWLSGTALSSSKTLPVILHNDVIRGDEGDPVTVPLFYTSVTSDLQATQAQAEAGTDSTTWMSPLRTAQAIAALGGSGGGGGGSTAWNDITDKPSTFAPSPHTHPLSELTQSGATSGQVATFDGTEWVPQTPSGGSGGTPDAHAASHATGESDEITPASIGAAEATHSHAITDVTGLQSELDGKQAAGSYAPATGIAPSAITGTAVITTDSRLSNARTPTSHTHAASEITSGTLDIARIPTGTTSSKVCLGNDSRLSDSRTPTSHTHGNLTNSGAIGTTSGVPIITGAFGVLQAGAFGTTAGTFCQGNDSRLINLSGGITAIAVVATMPATPNASTLYIVTT